jgi:MerR family transcriptional regulator/heat shock protein HspR
MPLPEPDAARGVYGITTAAELVGMSAQNLRLYESRGLLEPERTEGGTRRYSADDLKRLRRISELLAAGLNLAGIATVLSLETDNAELRAELGTLTTPPTTPQRPSRRNRPPGA